MEDAERKRHPKTLPYIDPDTGQLVKLCARCALVKEAVLFPQRGGGKLFAYCKPCKVEMERERLQNPAARALHREATKRHYAGNKAKCHAMTNDWRRRHSERSTAYTLAYQKRHPERVAAIERRRRERVKAAPATEKIDRAAIIERDNSTCYICSKHLEPREIALDHVIPLARGGSHTADNLRVACKPCNSRKHTSLPSEIGLEL